METRTTVIAVLGIIIIALLVAGGHGADCGDVETMLESKIKPTVENADSLLKSCNCFIETKDMINADKCYSEVINICEIIRESEPSNKAIKKIEDDASEAMNQIEKVQWKNVTTNVNESCQCEISPSDPGLLRYEKLISQNSSDFVSWNNKGVYLYENCCFNDSLAAFEKAIKINPDQAEPYYNKGVVLYDTDPKSALECFNESVNIDPSFAEAWFNRYSILMPADINTSDASSMKAYEAAIESYNTAIKLVPEARNFEPPLLVCIKIRS